MDDRRKLADGKEIWVIKAGFPNTSEKKYWSEYIFSNSLKKYLERSGVYVVIESLDEWEDNKEADVVILLRGHEAYYPDRSKKNCVYIMWNLSHPDTITEDEYNAFDLVCIGAKKYGEKLKEKLSVPVEILPICADTEIFYPDEDPYGDKKHEFIFVGNSRYAKRKSVVWSVNHHIPLEIWGKNWDKVFPECMECVVEEHISNDELPELYRNSKVTVDDHYEDMLEKGFINTRIVESLACGLPVISDYSAVLEGMFGDAILCYKNEDEFVEKTEYIKNNYETVKEKVMKLWPIIKENYSFETNAKKLITFSKEIRKIKEEQKPPILDDLQRNPAESDKIDISVVIPIYNGEKYLSECLDSVLKQSLRTMEVICVDDGSNDKTISILKGFAQKDQRVKILRQHHKGAGEARNRGLSQAKGTYVLFLDVDDIFLDKMFEKIVDKGRHTQADVILYGAKRYNNETGEILETPWYLRKEKLPKRDPFTAQDVKGQLIALTNPAAWTKAFRREFVLKEQIEFQNLSNSNDVFFVFVALAAAKKIAAIKEDLLLYRIFRKNSIQNSKSRNPLCFLDAYEAVYDELNRRKIYEPVKAGFMNSVLSGCVYNLNSVGDAEAKKQIEKVLCSQRFLRMGLLNFPEEDYLNIAYRNQIAALPYVEEVRRMVSSIGEEKTETLLKMGNAENEKKVSVIIPVYNTQNYLRECMDSVVRQTLKEIEIICIDDGSTDDSLNILCEYAENDNRITVFHQENSGLSVARNRGLFHATAKYVYFMDSDDILRQDALEELYRLGIEKDLDVICFNGITFYDSEETKNLYPEYENYYCRKGNYPKECTGAEMLISMRRNGEYRVSVPIQFFRRDFLLEEELMFQPGILHEDNDFSFRAMLLAKKAGYLGESFYNRRVRMQSIMTGETKYKHIYGYFISFLKMFEFVSTRDFPDEFPEYLYDILSSVLNNAKKGYCELSDAEKLAFQGLGGKEFIQFRLFIENGSGDFEIRRLKKELTSIKRSRSYKLARIIGSPVRMIRKVMKTVRRNI